MLDSRADGRYILWLQHNLVIVGRVLLPKGGCKHVGITVTGDLVQSRRGNLGETTSPQNLRRRRRRIRRCILSLSLLQSRRHAARGHNQGSTGNTLVCRGITSVLCRPRCRILILNLGRRLRGLCRVIIRMRHDRLTTSGSSQGRSSTNPATLGCRSSRSSSNRLGDIGLHLWYRLGRLSLGSWC